jgi:hypothetical protein
MIKNSITNQCVVYGKTFIRKDQRFKWISLTTKNLSILWFTHVYTYHLTFSNRLSILLLFTQIFY